MSVAKPFVSNIKIKGLHFFPPVINEEKSTELKRYKEQAIKLEKYLRNAKILHNNIEELLASPKLSRSQSLNSNSKPVHRKKRVSLSVDIVDVSEYSHEGIKVIDQQNKVNLHSAQSSVDDLEANIKSTKGSESSNEVVILFSSKFDEGKSRRDSLPSQTTPDQFQEQPKPRLIRSNSYTLDTPSPLLLAHLEKEKANKTLIDEPSQDNSELDSLSTVITKDEKQSPELEVIQTDISVQSISVNTTGDKHSSISEEQLTELLKGIPEEYSKKIYDIITQHKQIDDKTENSVSEILYIDRPTTNDSSSITASPSYTFYNTISSSSTPLPTLNQLGRLKTPETANKDFPVDQQEIFFDARSNVNICPVEKLSRSFSLRKAKESQARREWAATIITAYAKGYLTRRLLNTERVQSIIETIKDALICALQMHNSNSLDESDVELHRRLLNQVNAACYAFHDIFFALSPQEKMALISADRKRKTEKAKRPVSAPAIRRLVTPVRPQFKTLMTKSLTKI